MKKLIMIMCFAATILPVMAQKNNSSQSSSTPQSEIKLPEPTRKIDVSLYDALYKRQTSRTFDNSKTLTKQQLSDLLWCANGINRSDGKRTAPSARNAQEIDVYVLLSDGIYLYDAKEHKLKLINVTDIRPEVAMRGKMVTDAAVTLLFVANYEKMANFDEEAREFYGATDAGYVSQNVYLYCAANNLNTVAMGAINRDIIQEHIQFDGKVILAQPVGYPGKE